jgi:uncharacterized protein (TIGR02172 family)
MNEIEKINLDDYIQTGEGGTALSYTSKDGKTLAKLYNLGFEADRAREEFLTARTVFEMGIPTPEPYRLVTDGARLGGEYELIKGKRSFARIISQEPERLEEISLEFARMAKELHAIKADTMRMHSFKQVMVRFYQETDMIPKDYSRRILDFLEKVPESEYCIHGDLQIGNIISDGRRKLWIDVGEFAYGVPEWDLSTVYEFSHITNAKLTDFLLHLQPETLAAHWDIFLPAYLGTTDPQRIEEATRRIRPFVSAKTPFMLFIANHLELIPQALQRLVKLLD